MQLAHLLAASEPVQASASSGDEALHAPHETAPAEAGEFPAARSRWR